LRSPEVIKQLLETSNIALFSLARPLLSEPNLPNHWQSSDRQRAKCVSCNGCLQYRPGGNVCILNLKKGTPATFVFYENWASAEHLQKHIETEHFTQCLETIEELTKDTIIQELTQIAS